jgi:hypothetical protein
MRISLCATYLPLCLSHRLEQSDSATHGANRERLAKHGRRERRKIDEGCSDRAFLAGCRFPQGFIFGPWVEARRRCKPFRVSHLKPLILGAGRSVTNVYSGAEQKLNTIYPNRHTEHDAKPTREHICGEAAPQRVERSRLWWWASKGAVAGGPMSICPPPPLVARNRSCR